MARRPRRSKDHQGEPEALQVELLTEQDSSAGAKEAEGADRAAASWGGELGASEPPPPPSGSPDHEGDVPAAEAPVSLSAPDGALAGPGHESGSVDAVPSPGDGSVEVDGEARQVAPGGTFVDRWARAVGRSGPARSAGAEPGDAANGHEAHESARDHAAARVRPAGEPLARAKDLVQRGRVDEAIELYMGILTVNPTNLKARNNLGVLLDGLRQYESALEHFGAAEQIAPENVDVLTNYASTLTSVARYDEAETLLRRAHRLDAESLQVRLALGILYFRRGLYDQAEAELRWVCARDRDNGQAFYYRGEALNRLGRFDEAGQAMERAKVLLPTDPRPFYTLGHLYDRKHQPEEAAEMYRHARRLQRR